MRKTATQSKTAGAGAVGAFFALFLALAIGAAWVPGAAQAQPAPPGCVPSPTNMPNAGYPRVCPDYKVIFKLEAPNARKVQLQPNPGAAGNGLGIGPFDMVKGADGVWSVTIGPVVPGFHHYNFVVDGLAVNDPGSDAYTISLGIDATRGLNRASSGLEVPEKGVDFYLPKDVPHGVVQELWYKAKTTGEYRRMFVYTPPGYDKSLTTRFPVLYLQHGGTNDETSWVREGHISNIMDNLLAEKKIVPMLVVMDRGYGTWLQTAAQQDVPFNPALYTAADVKSRALFAQIMVKDVVPLIDGRYRTIADRDHRAIAGLSRGAEQALQIGVTNLDTFASVGSFSGSGAARNYFDAPTIYADGLFTKPNVLNSRLHVLSLATGTAEGGYPDNMRFHQALEKNGVKHVYFEVPGTAHEWATWRRQLLDFAPRLFRTTQ